KTRPNGPRRPEPQRAGTETRARSKLDASVLSHALRLGEPRSGDFVHSPGLGGRGQRSEVRGRRWRRKKKVTLGNSRLQGQAAGFPKCLIINDFFRELLGRLEDPALNS